MTRNSFLNTLSTFAGVFFMSILGIVNSSTAQERCASHLILQERNESSDKFSDSKFENWMDEKIQHEALRQLNATGAKKQAQVVQIPVVFHVIHKGEAIGTGVNLSKERIDRQLETLNEDFNLRNLNSDETLTEFKDLVADIEIEFFYALQDPEGFATDGIVRTIGSQLTYSFGQRAILAAESYWPAEDYLNIWITDVSAANLGWAEFPIANLPGLDEASGNRLIDGVTIDYQYIGDNPASPVFESEGRTLTHEMGHFLGLRHIWGDGGCSVDDYCDDTPDSNTFTSGCNLSKTSCNSLDMVQNFMDYTNDECMTLFTADQKDRMRIVIENSPRRLSLTTSPGLLEPIPLNYDLALFPINQTFNSNCTNEFLPVVGVRNQGSDSLYNFSILLLLNGVSVEQITYLDTIASGDELIVAFDSLSFNNFGSYELTYKATLNNLVDERISNNEVKEFYQRHRSRNLPYKKDFKQGLTDWLVQNPDGEETWVSLEGYVGVPLFDKRTNLGEKDALISPIFNFTQLDIPALNLVYAQAADSVAHQLAIYASYDCGATFPDLIYRSQRTDVATAYKDIEGFVPEYRLDWDSLYIDLDNLRNESSVCFRLEVENRGTDNFYLSEFGLAESNIPEKRVSPVNWKKANSLYCEENLMTTLTIKNTGRTVVNNFTVTIKNGNEVLQELAFNELLFSNQVKLLDLPAFEAPTNSGTLQLVVKTEFDEEIIEASIFLPYALSCTEELPPIRLDLSKASNENWFVFNPDQQSSWMFNNEKNAMSSESAFAVNELEQDWLISPIIDVSRIDFLSLIFKVAYHKPYTQNEGLEIYLFDASGVFNETLIYKKVGDSLATSFGNEDAFEPQFRNELIDISAYTFKEKIRVAIKALHDNGANIYLKDVTLFLGQETPPIYPNTRKQFVVYPNPVTDGILNLHFNLTLADEGTFQVLDTQGKVILKFTEPKILNQFITFDVSSLATGLYLLNFQSSNLNESVRFLVD